MARDDRFRRTFEAGTAFLDLTRERAEALVKEFVKAGEVQKGKAQKAIDDLLERSRKTSDELREFVRKEIVDQVGSLGLATKADIERLEARLGGPTTAAPTTAAPAAPTPRTPRPAKAAPVKKAGARKATAGGVVVPMPTQSIGGAAKANKARSTPSSVKGAAKAPAVRSKGKGAPPTPSDGPSADGS